MEKIDCAHTELMPIHSLKPALDNPNTHPLEQIIRLSEAIAHQGQKKAVVVSNQSGRMVTGHGMLEAIKMLGWKFVAVDKQNFATPEDEYMHMTCDNELQKWSKTDLAMVNLKIQEFDPDTDLKLLGFKDFKVDVAEKGPKEEEALVLAICPECGHKF